MLILPKGLEIPEETPLLNGPVLPNVTILGTQLLAHEPLTYAQTIGYITQKELYKHQSSLVLVSISEAEWRGISCLGQKGSTGNREPTRHFLPPGNIKQCLLTFLLSQLKGGYSWHLLGRNQGQC